MKIEDRGLTAGGGSAPLTTHHAPPTRIAVVGGGLTGLAAAHRLLELGRETNASLQVTLFEAGPRPGGVVGTQHIGGYLVELGADSFITNKPWAVDLCRRLGLQERLISTDPTYRRSLVLRKGKPVAVPEGFMLLAPAQVWPVLMSPLFSPLGKLRMGLEYFIPRRTGDGDESLASFVRRRFGREALERLVQPLVGGIYTSDPEKLSLRATMPRFLDMERQYRSLIRASRRDASRQPDPQRRDSGARYSLFATLAGGIAELTDTLTARVAEQATLRTDTAVASLTPHVIGDRCEWEIGLRDGTRERFDAVILAVRAYQAAELLAPHAGPLAELLRGIEYASSAIVVSGHRLADVRHPLDAFGLVVPAIERRKILAVSFASRKFPGRAPDGHVLLRTFVGGAMQPELMLLSDDELIAVVREELRDVLGVGGREDFAQVARYDRAMPQYHVGHVERIAQIRRHLAAHRGLALAGNAYDGVGIPDCLHSGQQAAEQVWAVASSVD